MPRFSTTLRDENGKAIGIACGSYRRKRCSYCAVLGAELECDGCDRALCKTCAVSPRDGLDFCARCFEPAWRHWLELQPRSMVQFDTDRLKRRNAFRHWARVAPEVFLRLVPLGEFSRKQTPLPPHLLFKIAEGDDAKYRALMVEHGHLIDKETR